MPWGCCYRYTIKIKHKNTWFAWYAIIVLKTFVYGTRTTNALFFALWTYWGEILVIDAHLRQGKTYITSRAWKKMLLTETLVLVIWYWFDTTVWFRISLVCFCYNWNSIVKSEINYTWGDKSRKWPLLRFSQKWVPSAII